MQQEFVNHPNILSIVIVNINQRELLQKCILSIFREAGELILDVIVVDNDSRDGSPEMIRALFPNVRLIQTSGRKGFAENNNVGIKMAKGEYVLILNNDTELLSLDNGQKLLPAMIERLEKDPFAGCLGPMLIRPDKKIQFEAARDEFLIRDWIFITLWLDQFFPNNKIFGHFNMTYWDHTTEQFVNCILGACMLMRKSLLMQIDGFDERFFLMAEDIDLCKRIRNAGFEILYAPQFRVLHIGNQTIRQGESYASRIETNLSVYKYIKKYKGDVYARVFRILALFLLIPKILFIENSLIAPWFGRTSLPLGDRLNACANIIKWRSIYTGETVF